MIHAAAAIIKATSETSEVVEHRPASLVLVRIVRPKFFRKRVARHDTPIEPGESPAKFWPWKGGNPGRRGDSGTSSSVVNYRNYWDHRSLG